MARADKPAQRAVEIEAIGLLQGNGFGLQRGADAGIGRLEKGRVDMRRIAVIGAMLAGLFVAGCTEPDSRLDDGWKMLVAQEFNDARAHYESMLAEDPNNPYVNLNLGVAYEALGDSTQAAKHYQVAVANGKDAEIEEVAQDGNVAPRQTTVAKVAEENLAGLNS